MKIKALVSVVLLLTGLAAANPAETASSDSPTRTEVLAARATPARRILLTNGMVILLKESPAHDLIAVELLCQVGLANEETPTAGLIALWSRILEERLDDATEQHFRIVDKSVSLEPDFLRISIQGPAEDGEAMITALADLVKEDTYSEKVVARHRKRLVDDIKEGRAGSQNQLYSIFRVLF